MGVSGELGRVVPKKLVDEGASVVRRDTLKPVVLTPRKPAPRNYSTLTHRVSDVGPSDEARAARPLATPFYEIPVKHLAATFAARVPTVRTGSQFVDLAIEALSAADRKTNFWPGRRAQKRELVDTILAQTQRIGLHDTDVRELRARIQGFVKKHLPLPEQNARMNYPMPATTAARLAELALSSAHTGDWGGKIYRAYESVGGKPEVIDVAALESKLESLALGSRETGFDLLKKLGFEPQRLYPHQTAQVYAHVLRVTGGAMMKGGAKDRAGALVEAIYTDLLDRHLAVAGPRENLAILELGIACAQLPITRRAESLMRQAMSHYRGGFGGTDKGLENALKRGVPFELVKEVKTSFDAYGVY